MAIMVCYDGTDSARRAVSFAARLLSGRQALIVHAWPVSMLPAADGSDGEPLADPHRQETAEAVAEEGRRFAESAGLAARTIAVPAESTIPEALLDTALEHHPELIVVGTRGRHATELHLLGSVATAIARRANVPVLVVPTATQEPDLRS